MSVAEQEVLVEAILTDKTLASFGLIFALSTGLRIGELVGLQWSDFDMENKMFHVRRTLGRKKKMTAEAFGEYGEKTQLVVGMPKTSTSCRCIPLFVSDH